MKKELRIEDLISKNLVSKLKGAGMFKGEIFNVENLTRADRYYLDIALDGQQISYITADRFERFKNEETGEYDFWCEDLRRRFAIKTRPGRVIQHIYGSELMYSEQRKLRYMLFDSSNHEVMLVTGNDIAKYYNEDTYEERRGDLGSSCMRYCPSSFFEIYKKYCKMAVVMNKHTGKISARAVIFENCKSGTGYPSRDLMCRIYATDDIFYDMLKSWAIDNEIWVFNGGYSARDFITGHDEYFGIDEWKPYFVTESYLQDEMAFIPYLDNFEYCVESSDGTYSISPSKYYPDGDDYERYSGNHDTDGGYGYGSNYDYCDGCSFPCEDCWKDQHGGWDGDSYDYDDDDGYWD